MSRLFHADMDGGWIASPFDADAYRLAGDEAPASLPAGSLPGETLLLRTRNGAGEESPCWSLLAGRGARIRLNGEPLTLGLALLRHRDELRLDGAEPVYFSTERLAAVEAYARDDAPRCPRCAQPIARGEPAVRCPSCGVLHHQLPDRACWTHLPCCALCDQPTDLEAGLRWAPEEL